MSEHVLMPKSNVERMAQLMKAIRESSGSSEEVAARAKEALDLMNGEIELPSDSDPLLLDWFAAFAPRDPWDWFHPKMESECPVVTDVLKWAGQNHLRATCLDDQGWMKLDHVKSVHPDIYDEALAVQTKAFEEWDAREAWREEYKKQRSLQWPYFYARAMIVQRSQQ